MKSERRHELETNELAKKIIQAPDYMKLYGGRIALGVVVLAAVFLLVNYRMSSTRKALALSQQGLVQARGAVRALQMQNPALLIQAPTEVAARRRELISTAESNIDQVNDNSEDSKMLAHAAVLRGDLYWTVANLTELPGATTQPTLQVEPKPTDALSRAEQAYKAVLDQYADQSQAAVTARFGLAAIAENRGQWDEARRQYEAIAAIPGITAAYKTQAEDRLRMLGRLQQATQVASAGTTASNEATTKGATTQAAK